MSSLKGVLDVVRSIKKLDPRFERHGETLDEMCRRWTRIRTPDLPLEIRSYDPQWPVWFAAERDRIRSALGPAVERIHHFGSSAIVGQASKNIIDMAVVLTDWTSAQVPPAGLANLGYEDYGNSPMDRHSRWLWRLEGQQRAFVIHLCGAGSSWLETVRNHRDYLSAHPRERSRYEGLKRSLAQEKGQGFLQYTLNKVLLWIDLDEKSKAWREASDAGGGSQP